MEFQTMAKRLLFSILSILLFSVSTFSQQLLTLEQAINIAEEKNPELRVGRLEGAKFRDRINTLKTRQLPNFSLSVFSALNLNRTAFTFRRGAFGDFPGTGPIPDNNTSISAPIRPTNIIQARISQPLTDIYKVGLGVKQLQLEEQIAEERLRAQKQQTRAAVKRAYYQILMTQASILRAEENVKLCRELDRVTENYFIEKVALRDESLEMKAKLARAEHELLQLQNLSDSEQEQLNLILGRDISFRFVATASVGAPEYETDLKAAQEVALRNRPDLMEARLKVESASYETRLKKAEYIPEVSLDIDYLGLRNLEFLPRNFASVGIRVTWEPFDWGRKRHELKEKKKSGEQAKLAVVQVEAKIISEVNRAFRTLQEAKSLLKVTKLTQEGATEKLRIAINRYQAEYVLRKEVLQAEMLSIEAATEYQKALLSYWTAKSEMERVLGLD